MLIGAFGATSGTHPRDKSILADLLVDARELLGITLIRIIACA
jgi:hypothetical protein